MIERGQTLANPVTGEQMTFLETAAETDGERVVIELRVDPGGAVAAAHVHPGQWETFSVVSGTLGAKVAGREAELGPGQTLGVSPGDRRRERRSRHPRNLRGASRAGGAPLRVP